VLVANPQLRRLRVEGHTDNKGKARELLKLSQARAEAVRAQLIRRGVEPSRLEAVGRGMTMPIAPNMTANGRATNRRVEIVVEGGGQGTAPTPALPTDARSHFLRAQKAYTEGRTRAACRRSSPSSSRSRARA
jgi:OOP family OmpA-OmpF porin